VIGSAIALNILIKVPLVAGCALTLVDVLIILIFYNPSGSMRRLRCFEFFVMALVLGVVICFCIQLSYIEGVSVGEVFKGYIPSSSIVQAQGYVIYYYHQFVDTRVYTHAILPVSTLAAVFSARRSCLIVSISEAESYKHVFANLMLSQDTSPPCPPTLHLPP
jgi:NRAMP (natural resistance-associated macrophage protein)-like metal ion transporter